jgi:uncharacterized protein YlbG (UPF0298 family)
LLLGLVVFERARARILLIIVGGVFFLQFVCLSSKWEDLNLTSCFTSSMTTKTVCVRISEEEKRQLKKYGKLSATLREAMKFYLSTKESEKLLSKLEELQARNPVKISALEEVKLIQEDRTR